MRHIAYKVATQAERDAGKDVTYGEVSGTTPITTTRDTSDFYPKIIINFPVSIEVLQDAKALGILPELKAALIDDFTSFVNTL